ncbi:MAG: metalloregulator ArsR/SmtB family transcription factor [Erysipelothrix sp.]
MKETCEVKIIHQDDVDEAKNYINKLKVDKVLALAKLLSEENRLKIFLALSNQERLCVCDISAIIGATDATTSHHLLSMKRLGILESVKEGKMVYYSIIKSIESTRILEMIQEI